MKKIRAAVIGAGSFGRNHVRVINQLDNVELPAIVDLDAQKAQALAREYGSVPFASTREILGHIDAAIVATPTITHEAVATELLDAGIDILVEKPIADSSAAGERMARLAQERGCILQVGHLERFNPGVIALQKALTIPLFFEIHRLSIFTPRSLDIDVVLDLMIHDLDIVLSFTGEQPDDVRAAGISVLSGRVDIANVRLSFSSGCVANLTASRVSTEKVRKLRLFQPREYISLDYERQDAVRLTVRETDPVQGAFPHVGSIFQIGFEPLAAEHGEPLKLELEAFFRAVTARTQPRVDGFQAANALRLCEAILGKIKEHGNLVADTVRRYGKGS